VGRLRDALARRVRPAEPRADASAKALEAVDPADRDIMQRSMPYTMTSVERLQGLIDAVRYVEARGLPGAFVECGVWRGGSVLAMIATLQALGTDDRDVYLFDTFEGMTQPTEHDVSSRDGAALDNWRDAQKREDHPWNEVFGPEAFNQDSVRQTLNATGYPEDRLHLVAGPVEETVPEHSPSVIGLLRLDTDWYESTRHELLHLYPRLVDGGVLIIDDYGHWDGARRAVDEYFASQAAPVLLNRLDYSGRLAVKH
jgi:O-methyltransferase